jgi:hypothetical protein
LVLQCTSACCTPSFMYFFSSKGGINEGLCIQCCVYCGGRCVCMCAYPSRHIAAWHGFARMCVLDSAIVWQACALFPHVCVGLLNAESSCTHCLCMNLRMCALFPRVCVCVCVLLGAESSCGDFIPFRDAAFGLCTYALSILDCLRGVQKAMSCAMLSFARLVVLSWWVFPAAAEAESNSHPTHIVGQ